MIAPADVRTALARVRDPEVDRPITEMGFVADVTVHGDDVHVKLRLPTYFCAPNFTYLMMDDAQRAVEELAGVGRAHVELDDHFASGSLNTGVGSRRGFSAAFRGEATGELDEISDRFRRKAFLVRQERLCRVVEEAGAGEAELLALTLADLPACPARDDYLEARERLGIGCADSDGFLVTADGRAVEPGRLRAHRRAASVLALSYEANGAMCQSLLAARYPEPTPVTTEVRSAR